MFRLWVAADFGRGWFCRSANLVMVRCRVCCKFALLSVLGLISVVMSGLNCRVVGVNSGLPG